MIREAKIKLINPLNSVKFLNSWMIFRYEKMTYFNKFLIIEYNFIRKFSVVVSAVRAINFEIE